jgi:DinB superfamily
MVRVGAWTDRTWTFGLPIDAFPAVVERLRGTPARAEALVAGVSDAALRRLPERGWSAKQHLGHLDDLHELDEHRLAEFIARAPMLTAADMTNRRTKDADHNATPAAALLLRLRTRRLELVERMDALSDAGVAAVAIHPRLERPMRLIDWAYFVAEHDDHHLAAARQALRALAGPPG